MPDGDRSPRLSIGPDEAAELASRPDVRIADVRWSLDDDEAGERAFAEGHLPGAVYLHWLRDLSDPGDPVEGQLAPPDRFRQAMERAGIGDDTLVIAYDDNAIFLAPRLCWALQAYGHDRALWLEGGYPGWLRSGRPVTTAPAAPRPATFTVRERPELRRTKADVLAALDAGGPPLFDCRMDATWGASGAHIPGARRFPAPALLDDDGRLRSPRETACLAEQAGIPRDAPSILYCGGGVSASAAHVALRAAGFSQTSVYDGSWAEWGADPGTPKAPHQR
jgi:thiosulfate/3-mercaptopyruvate sulfurtransferase